MPEANDRVQPPERARLILVASTRARADASSRLLRLVRDNATTLKNRFQIHTTQGTAQKLYSTGLFGREDVKKHRKGGDGGVAQLAAMVARGECSAAILLLDPSDPWSDSVENRALRRVCIHRSVRLITTYAAAQRWLTFEEATEKSAAVAEESHSSTEKPKPHWRPLNWLDGNPNTSSEGDPEHLAIEKRTVALISHDKKKREMVQFVSAHLDRLSRHHRILTTGTTGWVLKFLFSNKGKETSLIREIQKAPDHPERERRILRVLREMKKELGLAEELDLSLQEQLSRIRSQIESDRNDRFVDKVMPLPSGPLGGDVLIAEEVLKSRCHSIVFFHDPLTAHPHDADIRVLEHTSQLPGVFSECVSDRISAERWIEGIEAEMRLADSTQLDRAHRLRQHFSLREAILVDTDSNKASSRLGQALARACAGYFNQILLDLVLRKRKGKEIRVGLSWGWGARAVLEQLIDMDKESLLERLPEGSFREIVWSPVIGTITAEITSDEAYIVAQGFCNLYGGRVEGIPCAGFTRDKQRMPEVVNEVLEKVRKADIILTAAAPWTEMTSLRHKTGLNPDYFPADHEAVGVISGVFLNKKGEQVPSQYSVVGLRFEDFQVAASAGIVILLCGGEGRQGILQAALLAGMVSSLVTTRTSAENLLRELDSGKLRRGK